MIEIYSLSDETGVRYIGKSRNSASRLKRHFTDARRRDTRMYRWLRKLQSSGLSPILEVLEVVEDSDWPQAERKQIASHIARGCNLVNLAEGGNEPYCSPEVRSANGRTLTKWINQTELSRFVWSAKRQVGVGLKNGEIPNSTRAKFRYAAAKCPEMFGCWASMPDRVE
jgi:hypothetical protein